MPQNIKILHAAGFAGLSKTHCHNFGTFGAFSHNSRQCINQYIKMFGSIKTIFGNIFN